MLVFIFLLSITLSATVNREELTGNKTIKLSGGDYSSLGAAILALNTNGVGAGGVTFIIDDGINLNEACQTIIATGTVDKPIIFQRSGSSSVKPIFRFTGTAVLNAAIKLSGSDYITFDGIEIQDAGTGISSYIEFAFQLSTNETNGCQHNCIKNCKIDLTHNNFNSKAIYMKSIATVSTGTNSYNRFINNQVTDSFSGYYFDSSEVVDVGNEIKNEDGEAHTVSNIGSSNTTSNYMYGIYMNNQSQAIVSGITISSNVITQNTIYGIKIEGVSSSLIIKDNMISNIRSTSSVFGIAISSGSTVTIEGNSIYQMSSTITNYGIVIQATNNLIQKNQIYALESTGSSGKVIGVIIQNNAMVTTIANNMIYDIKSVNSSQQPSVIAVSIGAGSSNELYNNTFYLDYIANQSDNVSAVILANSSGRGIDLKNNIIINKVVASGSNAKAVCFFATNADVINSIVSSTDYNLYYAGIVSPKNLIYYNQSVGDQTIAAFKQRLGNREQNSVTEDVHFINTTTPYNLHIPLGSVTVCSHGGIEIPSIIDDIDNQIREIPPDIGADEFSFSDQDSYVSNPAIQVPSAEISSLSTTWEEATSVFKCNITDTGSSDLLDTRIVRMQFTKISIIPLNTILSGACIKQGDVIVPQDSVQITATNIICYFSDNGVNVANNSTVEITLQVYVKDSFLPDGEKLQLAVSNAAHGWVSAEEGSHLSLSFPQDVQGNEHTIQVIATRIMVTMSQYLLELYPFSIQVKAVDLHGNQDIHYQQSVTVMQLSGSGHLSSENTLTSSINNGEGFLNGLIYDRSGTFKLKVESGDLLSYTTSDITSGQYLQLGVNPVGHQSLPIDPSYDFSYSQSIFHPNEIPQGYIQRIAVHYNGNSSFSDSIRIYCKLTTQESFSSVVNWIPISEEDLVFNSVVTTSSVSDWCTIQFPHPFYYNGEQNLLIAFLDRGNTSQEGQGDYDSYSTDENRSLYLSRDELLIDPITLATPATRVVQCLPMLRITMPVIMEVVSIQSEAVNQLNLHAKATNQVLLCISLQVAGKKDPMHLSQFCFANTDNYSTNIGQTNIFYTGSNDHFSTTSIFGSTSMLSPINKNRMFMRQALTINGEKELTAGIYYFWLAVDTQNDPIIGACIQATNTNVNINGNIYNNYIKSETANRFIAGKRFTASNVYVCQSSTSSVYAGSKKQDILQILMHVEESTDPTQGTNHLTWDGFTVLYKNTHNSDIDSVYLLTTGNDNSFVDNRLVCKAPLEYNTNGWYLTNMQYEIPWDDSYYWIAYAVKSGALSGDSLDVRLPANAFCVNTISIPMIEQDPPGYRQVVNPNYGGGTETQGGYYYATSLAEGIISKPVFNWVDITSTGQSIEALLTDTNGYIGGDSGCEIGFNFPYFGQYYHRVWIGADGWISFSKPHLSSSTEENSTIPYNDELNNLIAVFWDNLIPTLSPMTGHIWIQSIGNGDSQYFIVTYEDIALAAQTDTDAWITAQCILKANGSILMQYLQHGSNTNLTSVTVGIENSLGTKGVQYLYNGSGGLLFSDTKDEGLAIAYNWDPQTLPIVLSSFTIERLNSNSCRINWVTQSENNLSGFWLYRGENTQQNQATSITDDMIIAHNQAYNYLLIDNQLMDKHTYYYWLRIAELDGSYTDFGPISYTHHNDIPSYPKTDLIDAYPNPFNPSINIQYALCDISPTVLTIYNAKGQKVKVLYNGIQNAGTYIEKWNGTNEYGVECANGIYFYQLRTPSYSETRKMLLLK